MKTRSITIRISDDLKAELQATDPSADISELVRRSIRHALDSREALPPAHIIASYTGVIAADGGSLVLVITPLVRLYSWPRGYPVRLRLTSEGKTVSLSAPVMCSSCSYILRITEACRSLGLTAGSRVSVDILA